MSIARKRIRQIITGMICLTMLAALTGCQQKSGSIGQTNPNSSTKGKQEKPQSPETKVEDDENTKAQYSLASLRQSMEGTSQQFAVAYLGYVEDAYVDHVQDWIKLRYPELLSEMLFIEKIDNERICGNGPAELFCIVPRSGDDPVDVNLMEMNYETGVQETKQNLYKSETGEPFLLMCNGASEGIGQVLVSMGNEAGYQADWSPMMNMDGRIWIPTTESGVEQAKDFTDYKACDARRFEDCYGSVSEDIQQADLTDTSWEIRVGVGESDTYGDYFLELLNDGYARISWCEKEYGADEDTYGDIVYEIYEGEWHCVQQDGHSYLKIKTRRTGGEWCYEGEEPVVWEEDFRIYGMYDNTMLLLENENGVINMPSKEADCRVICAIKTYG